MIVSLTAMGIGVIGFPAYTARYYQREKRCCGPMPQNTMVLLVDLVMLAFSGLKLFRPEALVNLLY